MRDHRYTGNRRVRTRCHWLASGLPHVQQIRRVGYATVDEEFEPGLVRVSAPVYGFHGDIIAAINVAAPKQRLGDHLKPAGEFARKIADEMSAALGTPQRH